MPPEGQIKDVYSGPGIIRPDWCPIEDDIQVPHGRLIDADELIATMHMDGYAGFATMHDANLCIRYINNMPTIIEAEKIDAANDY